MTAGVGVLPRGGREISLRCGNLETLWRNPAGYGNAAWPNPGGGRTWVSPESELFFPDREAGWPAYRVPPELDPGAYEVLDAGAAGVSLRNRFTARFFGDQSTLELEVTKSVAPLREAPFALPEEIAFAGYALDVELRALGIPSAGQKPAVWNLLQVPPGGSILFKNTNPVSYFGRPGHRPENGGVRLDVSAPGESYKLGFRPAPGKEIRLFYRHFDAESPYFLVRTFTSPERCADAPFPGDAAPPCPVQLFSDNGDAGGFGELEYHTGYLTPECREITDTSSTWAFAGKRGRLEALFKRLWEEA